MGIGSKRRRVNGAVIDGVIKEGKMIEEIMEEKEGKVSGRKVKG